MFSQYMQKSASLVKDMKGFTAKATSMVERSANAKTAAVSVVKDRAERLAHALSTTRLPSGHTFLEGHDQIKAASTMLQTHDHALSMVELIIGSLKDAMQKAAEMEIGRPTGVSKSQQLSAEDELIRSVRGSL